MSSLSLEAAAMLWTYCWAVETEKSAKVNDEEIKRREAFISALIERAEAEEKREEKEKKKEKGKEQERPRSLSRDATSQKQGFRSQHHHERVRRSPRFVVVFVYCWDGSVTERLLFPSFQLCLCRFASFSLSCFPFNPPLFFHFWWYFFLIIDLSSPFCPFHLPVFTGVLFSLLV